ncbi:DUF3027 domain-containing protein [Arthrobacter burdickii]|uniref:DUF3027 domain-containing protein n=1 Tax=Arthrobacter burdickii TaxID=3035920 RepID=A0ABT8K5R2_9MICC|nr:DUF3027 domain-containing protein [Arthrobacter burdickii]MDN4612151.1 DUF3027 domain-containing protein [Arthrobacter burdickii]
MTSSNLETAGGAAPTDAGSAPADATPTEAPRKVSRRIPKSDAVLEAAVDRARRGVLEVAPEAQVGRHVSATIEGERLVTHRFEAFVPGYGGWQWYASVARVARSKDVTVCEVGLLPSAASLLAPEWLPWSERVRPEDSEPDETPSDETPSDETPSDSEPDETPSDEAPSDKASSDEVPADLGQDQDKDQAPDGASAVVEKAGPDAGSPEEAGDSDVDPLEGAAGTSADRTDDVTSRDAEGQPDAG